MVNKLSMVLEIENWNVEGLRMSQKMRLNTIIISLLSFIFISACNKGVESNTPNEKEIFTTQEEFQMQLLEWLDDSRLLVGERFSIDNWPKEKIAPGIEIYSERFKLYAYCNRFYDGDRSVTVSIEDISKLYYAYDEKLYSNFRTFYEWLRIRNGESFSIGYDNSIRCAYNLYVERYGNFNGKDSYVKMTTDDKISLEKYIRDNPHFMPKEEYETELRILLTID